MKRFFVFILITAVLTIPACRSDAGKNIFQNKTLQTIYTLQNQRDTTGLLPYLKDKNPVYRKAAATAFASVQGPAAIEPLAALFDDPDEGIRSAAAYALGQIKDKAAEPILLKIYKTEKSPMVRRDILEAMGKCGTTEGLTFITNLKIGKQETQLLTGQAWGLYRFGLQNIVSQQGTARAIALIHPDMPEKARFIAANYLSRTRGLDLNTYAAQLLQGFNTEKHLFTRMNLVLAMGKAVKPKILVLLTSLLTPGANVDYRIKAHALRALRGFDYLTIRELLFNGLKDKNTNVSIAAAEFLLANGKSKDAPSYLDIALELPHWRSRATLLNAALKYADKEDKELKEKISQTIIDAFKKSQNNYEKAWLLTALGDDPANYEFVETQTFARKGTVVGSNGINALVRMSRAVKQDDKMMSLFTGIFQKAVASGDPALMSTAANILRNPEMTFKKYIKDTSFLNTAMNQCKLPEDIEAWLELRRTIDFFEDTKTAEDKLPVKNKPIDWQLVTSIAPDRQVKIKTTKGDIVIGLLVNESPGSVSNFVQLIKENFYKNNMVHRVVPNFVIQDGCPRGDGWGSPPFTIGSEVGPLYYDEGCVGMASAGKDTEGSQWFITHSPTPHLDGRYTIFAKVISGMDVVHKIEVGDKVLEYELL